MGKGVETAERKWEMRECGQLKKIKWKRWELPEKLMGGGRKCGFIEF